MNHRGPALLGNVSRQLLVDARRRPRGRPRRGTRGRPDSCRTSGAAGGRCSPPCGPGRRGRPASGSTAWIWARVSTSAIPAWWRAVEVKVLLDLGLAAGDDPVDEAHHVESGAVDGLVGGQTERRGHGHAGRTQGGDDLVLASHVVGGREHMAGGRAAQHVTASAAVADLEGQVAPTAGDQAKVQREDHSGNVVHKPGADSLGIDAGGDAGTLRGRSGGVVHDPAT